MIPDSYKAFRRSLALLLLTVLLTFFSGSGLVADVHGSQKNNPQGMDIQYSKAKDSYYLLIRDKQMQGDRQNWLNGISEFRRIYHDDPQGKFAANCLFMMAKMHYRMYMRFHRQTDLDESIAHYSDVSLLFPENTLADDAIFWTAEIYRKDKKNPRQAAKLYAKQITLYPGGDKYGQAASRLQEIKGKHNIKLPEQYSASQQPVKRMQVLPAQYWSSDNYTRIVIRSSGPVRYKSYLTPKKQNQTRRLLVEFAQSTVEAKYTEPVVTDGGLLQKIRTQQTGPATVTVAMDIESISTYKIFSLNDPFRVIVDVQGQQKIISTSKALPQVGREQVASRSRLSSSRTRPELKPATKKRITGNSGNALPDHSDPFIVLEGHNKRKPGSAATKKQTSAESLDLTLAQQLGLRVRRIVIDPGHGGKDPGAMAHGLREKDLTLKVAKMTALRLQDKYEYEVILTRDGDTSLSLEERTAIANTLKADLFISIHVNAHPSDTVRGIETFYLNLATNTEAMRVAARENATTTHNISDLQDILSDLMQNSKIQESSVLADYVQHSLIAGLRENRYAAEDLGVKQAPFYVLIGAKMPAILAEISFLSNRTEADLLRDSAYLGEIADQIAAGVAGYVEHQATAALRL